MNNINDRKQPRRWQAGRWREARAGRRVSATTDVDSHRRRRPGWHGRQWATWSGGGRRIWEGDQSPRQCQVVQPATPHPWSQPSLCPPHPQHTGTQPRLWLKTVSPSRARRFSTLSGMLSEADPQSGKCPHLAAILTDESDRAALLSRYNTVVQWYAHRNHEVVYPTKRRKVSTPTMFSSTIRLMSYTQHR